MDTRDAETGGDGGQGYEGEVTGFLVGRCARVAILEVGLAVLGRRSEV